MANNITDFENAKKRAKKNKDDSAIDIMRKQAFIDAYRTLRLELLTADQQQLVSALTSCSHQVTHQYYHREMEQSILYRLQ